MARAAVGDGGAVFRYLQGREHAVRLAYAGLNRVAVHPTVHVVVEVVIRVRHVAGGLRELYARTLTEAEVLGVLHELAYAEVVRHGVEEDVA